ncbi:MAG TPA: CHAT domain-containing tetratricopeptide repeat protein [Pirellulales bacterium]|jgi:CHAT domain-containing protein/tetratricopeptide (TPR) repeat protein|nr:CHAT domain-containing tetratricopeptide repeat protein [Pirellulales bacterium]
MRACLSTVVLLLVGLSSIFAAEPATAPADQTTVLRASAFFAAGRLVEAERMFRDVLAAVDAGSLPKQELGHCLGPLVQIYRTWGRNDDALRMAERFRTFLQNAPKLDATIRQQQLDEIALQLVDILTALNRSDDAEHYLADAIRANQSERGDPTRRLLLLMKSAQLAEAEGDSAKSRERWSQVVAEGKVEVARVEKRELPAKVFPDCVAALSVAYVALEDFSAAIEIKRKLLDVQIARKDRAAEVTTRSEIGSLRLQDREFAAARDEFTAALAIEHKLAVGSLTEADLESRLAGVLQAQGFVSDAKQHWGVAAALYADALAKAERDENGINAVMSLLGQLETVYQQMGQFGEAIGFGRRLLELRQERLGRDHPLTQAASADLGALYGAVENYEAAKPLLTKSLDYWRRRNPPAPNPLARALNDLGVVERAIGSFTEAQALFEEALAVRTRILHPDDMRLAYSLNNLASVYLAKGEYAKAINLFDRAIDIYRQRGRVAEDSLSNSLLNLAMAYKSQGEFDRALGKCREAIDVFERVFGRDAPGAVSLYSAMTWLDIATNRLDDAAESNRHAWELCQADKLEHEPVAATVLNQRAAIASRRGEFDAAAHDWNRAIEIQQAAGQTSQVARTLYFLGTAESLRGQPGKAETLFRKALALQQTIQAYPAVHYLTYCNLAEILRGEGKLDEAITLLQAAVKLVEAPRAGTFGAEEERAEYFSHFDFAFDLLVACNLQAGRIDEAFQFAEQGRNRTFLDQLSLAGVDLRETLTGPGAKELLDRERTLRTKLGTLRGQMQAAAGATDPQSSLDQLLKDYAGAQEQFAQVWTDIRNASSFYREQRERGTPIGSLDSIRRLMGDSHNLMLFYYLGSKESHLLIIGDPQTPVDVVPLVIPEPLAAGLKMKAGPLTRPIAVQIVSQYLADLRDRAGGRGLSGIVHSQKGVMAAEQGTQLAEVLLPREVRKRIAERNPQGITIVPDGALHQLPFEALLLESGESPRYLLDVFPSITYAPSATILVNLLSRPAADPKTAATVLTVGNPHYPQTDDKLHLDSLAAVSRDAFLELGGRLPLLPGTAKECDRVAESFPADRVKRLEWDDATEGNVRSQIANRRYIHLAAHGLVDTQHDNLFGAIALAPSRGMSESSDDDGFLSIHEIHELPLSGCELVVLSACQTNVGPDRPLEAGATLAQAFLAAGGKRVVCSHWNVDDASTAELMGTFFGAIAKADRQGTKVNYATALAEARKSIRANPKWASPYYWAPFVLLGPAE